MRFFCVKGCVAKSASPADLVSTTPATVLFVMIMVLLGAATIGVVVYVTKRVKTSR